MSKLLDRVVRVPVEKILTPFDGAEVCMNWWWIVLDGCVLFYRGFAAQRNKDKELTESIRDKLYPGAEVRFIPVAYLDSRERECPLPPEHRD